MIAQETQYVMQAFAKLFANNKAELISSVAKSGGELSPDPSNEELLAEVGYLIKNNPDFVETLDQLLLKHGYIKFKNQIGAAIMSMLPALTPVIEAGTSQIGAGKERALEQQRLATEQQTALLTYLSEEENAKAQKKKTQTIAIIGISAIAIGFAGFLIWTKSKQSKK